MANAVELSGGLVINVDNINYLKRRAIDSGERDDAGDPIYKYPVSINFNNSVFTTTLDQEDMTELEAALGI